MEALDHHYAKAASELSERRYDSGLLARCFAEAEGDESKARARYLLLRAAQFAQDELDREHEERRNEAKRHDEELRAEELRQAAIISERAKEDRDAILRGIRSPAGAKISTLFKQLLAPAIMVLIAILILLSLKWILR